MPYLGPKPVNVRSASSLIVDGNLTAGGTTSLAGASTTADINFGDNDKAIFGAGSDLQIYHNSSNNRSYITESGSGAFVIQGENLILEETGGSNYIQATAGGAVQVYYNGSEKLATTSTGVDVTGDIAGDSVMRIHSSDESRGSIQISAPNEVTNRQVSFGNNFYISGTSTFSQDSTVIGGSAIVMSAPNNNYGEFLFKAKQDPDTGGAVRDRMRIADNGDISFYEDTGTTPKLFWDASAEALGIGTSSPLRSLHVVDASADPVILERNTTGNVAIQATDGTDTVYFGMPTGGGFAIDDDANLLASPLLRVSTSGNLTPQGGIYLGGTGSANLLDDYEEGSWTPEFQYATSATYTSQQGIYRKIGTLVYIEWIINVSSHDTSDASSIHINLPFAAAANDDVLVTINQRESTLLPRSSTVTTPGTGGQIVNLTNINFSDAGTSLIQYANTNSSGVFRGAATYISNT